MVTSQGDEEYSNDKTGGREHLTGQGAIWKRAGVCRALREGGRSRPRRSCLGRDDFRQEKEVTGKRIICCSADLMRGKARMKGRGKQISGH